MLKQTIIAIIISISITPSFADIKFKLNTHSQFTIQNRNNSHDILRIEPLTHKVYINDVELSTSNYNKIDKGSVGKGELATESIVFKKISSKAIAKTIDNGSDTTLATPYAIRKYLKSQIAAMRTELDLPPPINSQVPHSNWKLEELKKRCLSADDTNETNHIPYDRSKPCYIDYTDNHKTIIQLPDSGEDGTYFAIYHKSIYETTISKANTTWSYNFIATTKDNFIYFIRQHNRWVAKNVTETIPGVGGYKFPPKHLLDDCITPDETKIRFINGEEYSIMSDTRADFLCYVDHDDNHIENVVLPQESADDNALLVLYHYGTKTLTVYHDNSPSSEVHYLKGNNKAMYFIYNQGEWERKELQ